MSVSMKQGKSRQKIRCVPGAQEACIVTAQDNRMGCSCEKAEHVFLKWHLRKIKGRVDYMKKEYHIAASTQT